MATRLKHKRLMIDFCLTYDPDVWSQKDITKIRKAIELYLSAMFSITKQALKDNNISQSTDDADND